MGNDLDPKKQFEHNNAAIDKVGVSQHPRAQGAPSASINDAEYANAAQERGEGVDDDNPATMPGFPVPVLKKTEHAKHLHETREEVATVEQSHRATDLAGDTGLASDKKALGDRVDNFGGTVETPLNKDSAKDGAGLS